MMDSRVNFEEKITDIFAKNVAALKEYFPDIYDKFKSYEETRYHFVYDAAGQFNLFDCEEKKNIYPHDPVKYAVETFSAYKESPVYFSKMFSMPSQLHEDVNPIHAQTVNALAKLKYVHAGTAAGSKIKLVQRMSSLMVTNVGLGLDIEYIFMNYDVLNGIVVEPDPDVFYSSLFVCRWYEIFKKQEANGFSLSLYVDFDVNNIMQLFHQHFYGVGRYKNNGIYFYSPINMGDDDYYVKISEYIQSALLDGFGFYDDSLYSVAASLNNARNNIPLYVHSDKNKMNLAQASNFDVPVFIIGAGPSLDSDMEFIKENQNKAFIISCGSGIKSLEVHGVKPDMHVECERTAITKHWLDQVDKEYLSKINFIGLNVIHPDTFHYFNRVGSMVKGKETGSLLMASCLADIKGRDYLPMFTFLNPTVVHTGVGVSPFVGFRELYLFGVDMGFKNPENHHSASSSYSDITDEYKEMLAPSTYIDAEANFEGSEIYTDNSYVSFKMHLENELIFLKSCFSAVKCFNCSDGVKIPATESLRSRDIDFLSDRPDLDKKSISDVIFDGFFEEQPDLFPEMLQELEKNIPLLKSVCKEMSDRFRVEVGDLREYESLMDKNISYLFHDENVFSDRNTYLLTLFTGSLLYYLSVVNNIAYSPLYREGQNIDFVNQGLIYVADFFDNVHDSFEETYLKIDDESKYSFFG